jgi:hypothetical protein
MEVKKSNFLVWLGLILIILNFVLWIFFRGSDEDLIITKGVRQYYFELFFWLVMLNIPAIIILVIGGFVGKKEKKTPEETKPLETKQTPESKKKQKTKRSKIEQTPETREEQKKKKSK